MGGPGVVAKASPCTVGLQVGAAQGSGVIVSRDGYVLTMPHVVGRPGREARIRLPGESELQGKTLGIHATADAGLVKIAGSGQWPYTPLVSRDQAPKVGDWCIALEISRGQDSESVQARFTDWKVHGESTAADVWQSKI